MPTLNEESPAQGVAKSLLGRLAMIGVAVACLCIGAEAHASSAPYPTAAEKAQIDRLIVYYAKRYNVPVALARKVVKSESEYRPLARNGPYWGLMQIRYDTAKGLGYRGSAKGLLDAETNLVYGIAYLANALTAANGNMSRGHMLYRTGYYYEAKRRRVLDDEPVADGLRALQQHIGLPRREIGTALYDLDADIGEHRSLTYEHPEIVKDLKARLQAWQDEMDASDREFIVR